MIPRRAQWRIRALAVREHRRWVQGMKLGGGALSVEESCAVKELARAMRIVRRLRDWNERSRENGEESYQYGQACADMLAALKGKR